MNVSWALSDQEREALTCEAVKTCQHVFSEWYTDQEPMPVYLPIVKYLHPGRQTRSCKCGWKEHRNEFQKTLDKHAQKL